VSCYIDFTRKLMLQSSQDVEALVANNLRKDIGTAIDVAAINGSGSSNQPMGILQTSGIGSVALGANGDVPTWSAMVDLMREVEIDDALDGQLAFLGNARGKAKLMKTPRQSSGVEGDFILGDPGNVLLGYPYATSENVPST
jgi:HK97 family phage major capsid protein